MISVFKKSDPTMELLRDPNVPTDRLVFYAPLDKASTTAETGQPLSQPSDCVYETYQGVPCIQMKGSAGVQSNMPSADFSDEALTVSYALNSSYTGTYIGLFYFSSDSQWMAFHPYGNDYIAIKINGGSPRVQIQNFVGSQQGFYRDGNWHIYTHIITEGSQKTYVDGVLYATSSYTGISFPSGADTVYIGDSGDGDYLQGSRMAAFRVYNRVLSQDEITRLASEDFNLQRTAYHTSSGFNALGRPIRYRDAISAQIQSGFSKDDLLFYHDFASGEEAECTSYDGVPCGTAKTGQEMTFYGDCKTGTLKYAIVDGIPCAWHYRWNENSYSNYMTGNQGAVCVYVPDFPEKWDEDRALVYTCYYKAYHTNASYNGSQVGGIILGQNSPGYNPSDMSWGARDGGDYKTWVGDHDYGFKVDDREWISFDKWGQIVIIKRNGTDELWYNGKLIQTGYSTYNPGHSHNYLFIDISTFGVNYELSHHYVSDVYAFRRALAPREIQNMWSEFSKDICKNSFAVEFNAYCAVGMEDYGYAEIASLALPKGCYADIDITSGKVLASHFFDGYEFGLLPDNSVTTPDGEIDGYTSAAFRVWANFEVTDEYTRISTYSISEYVLHHIDDNVPPEYVGTYRDSDTFNRPIRRLGVAAVGVWSEITPEDTPPFDWEVFEDDNGHQILRITITGDGEKHLARFRVYYQ